MKHALLLTGLLALGSSAHASRILANCGGYTITNSYSVEYDQTSVQGIPQNCASSDSLIDLECYSAPVTGARLEFVRTITWFDHRDRVQSDEISAVLVTHDGEEELSCEQVP